MDQNILPNLLIFKNLKLLKLSDILELALVHVFIYLNILSVFMEEPLHCIVYFEIPHHYIVIYISLFIIYTEKLMYLCDENT